MRRKTRLANTIAIVIVLLGAALILAAIVALVNL